MKLSGIVYLYLDFKLPLAAMTSASLDRKPLQALLRSSLGMLLKTSDGGDQGLFFCARIC
jgi:hypothetical protein